MVADWVHSASQVVETWPEDVARAPFDVAAARECFRLAENIPATLKPPRADAG
jgi:hypothetical protein